MPPTNISPLTVPTWPNFAAGDEVEVKFFEPHFGWTWFEAVVLCAGSGQGSVEVKYENEVEFWSGYTFLEKVVILSRVRPRPTRTKAEFRLGDAVEAFSNFRWVAGNVAQSSDWGCYEILFPDGSLELCYKASLRRRLDWVDGEWVAPANLWATKNSSKPVDGTNQASEPTSRTIRKRRCTPAGNSKMSKFRVHSSLKGSDNHEANLESHIRNDSGYSEPSTGDDIDGCAKNNEKRSRSTNGIPDELARINPELAIIEELTGESLVTCKSVKMTLTSVWDAFKAIPQCPHFRSLEKLKEDHREGIALGHLANFAKFADNLPTLGFDDSFDVLAIHRRD